LTNKGAKMWDLILEGLYVEFLKYNETKTIKISFGEYLRGIKC